MYTRASWTVLSPRGPKEAGCTRTLRSGTRLWEKALGMHPAGAAAAPRGGAKEGGLSSANVVVPSFLVKVGVWSRSWSEGEMRGRARVLKPKHQNRGEEKLEETVSDCTNHV